MNRIFAAACLAMALTSGCVDQVPPGTGGGGDDPDRGPTADVGPDTDSRSGGSDDMTPPGCEPADEQCNGVDDDCDDLVDEGFDVGDPCVLEAGGCTSDGTFACSEDGSEAVCDAPLPMSEDETCDQADNDCDGDVDEGFDTATDVENCGACGTTCARPNAQVACADSACALTGCEEGFKDLDEDLENGCECVIGDEVCDGLDNDCDGEIDEGFGLGERCTVGQGACAAEGERVCSADGGAVCGAEPGEPADEQCNTLDDDCDGSTDEGFDADGDGAPACGIDCDGPCPPGVDCDALCPIQDCAPDDGTRHPNAPEICEDGIDQNCDGRDITCEIPAGRIHRAAIAGADEPDCRDFTGDGQPDNAFGGAGGLINNQLQQSIDDESLNLLPIAPGLEPPGTDGVFDFAMLFGQPDGDAYRVSDDALDENGDPVMLFPGTRIAGGALEAGPGTFFLTLRNGGEQADLRIIETIITGQMGVGGDGVTLNDGWVTGIVTEEDFQAALVIVPEPFRAGVPFLVRPDIDRDGDGEPDAYSACLTMAASPASITGYPRE